MAAPEQEPQVPPEVVQHVETRFDPEVERQLHEVGAQVRPTAPQQTQDDQGRPITQPISDDSQASATQTITIPVTQDQAAHWSRGKPADSSTWLGITILRSIKKAIHHGWQIVIGKKQ